MSRADYLNSCDAALADKPRLSTVFDPAWRANLRARALAEPQDPAFGFPTAYCWPMLEVVDRVAFSPEIQSRMESGLAALWPQMYDRDRRDITERLRSHDSLAACDELLAAAAFVT